MYKNIEAAFLWNKEIFVLICRRLEQMEKKRLGSKALLAITAAVTVSFVTIFIFFNIYYDRIYNAILEKDMEQIEWTSHYVTKLIHGEIEYSMERLYASEEMFHEGKFRNGANGVKSLREVKEELHFEKMGLASLDGKSLDDSGNISKIDDTELFEAIQKDESYVSNIYEDLYNMRIAVPLHKDGQVIGALWGELSVSVIAEKIEMDNELHRYFQIIDDNGRYISHSGNIHSFAEDVDLWEEMKRYDITGSLTAEDIQKNVEQGKSGNFHFTYEGEGRYVTYEPLGINNWYVFSVVVEEFINDYVNEIEIIFFRILTGVIVCLIFITCFIGFFILRMMKTIKEQNKEVQIRNSLLSMILKRTNDILFEIDILKNQAYIYHHSLENEKVNYEVINDFSPEAVLEKGWIRPEDLEKYRKLFGEIKNGGKIEPVVMELKLEGKWDCNKIHALTVNKNYIIGFFEDYNEQMYRDRKIQEIKEKNQTDALTGLCSREYFMEEVERILKEKGGEHNICALFLLDLDHFKEINDTLGHIVGDQVLRETGIVLKSLIRNTDMAGRLGGDEFVVFLQNISSDHGVDICAEKMLSALKRVYREGEHTVSVSASIGIVQVTAETTFDELYKTADKALYEVKKAQKDGYRIAGR